MRGEEDSDAGAAVIRRELPPHARRRVQLVGGRAYMLGITSACAEKSQAVASWAGRVWNYLRMRGEESPVRWQTFASMELPPHARRRGPASSSTQRKPGITSACAEKSFGGAGFPHWRGNYLRMRGEECLYGCEFCVLSELPPRARRRGDGTPPPLDSSGITSACAEKSCKSI